MASTKYCNKSPSSPREIGATMNHPSSTLTDPVLPMIAAETVVRRILLIRAKKIMLDTDLAELYDIRPMSSIRPYGETSSASQQISCFS
jgi:hypothetical protein